MFQSTQTVAPKKESTRIDLLQRIAKAKKFIHANLDSSIDIKSLAGTACLSEYHFIRIFNEFVGLTPYQYILQKRILRAKELMSLNNYSLKEISQLSGFETVQTFRKCFKRMTGMSPSEFNNC